MQGTSKPYKNQWPEDQEKSPGRSDRYRRRMIKQDTNTNIEMLTKQPHYCVTCVHDSEAPTHNGSARCESGSIAAGGSRAHCSCELCF